MNRQYMYDRFIFYLNEEVIAWAEWTKPYTTKVQK